MRVGWPVHLLQRLEGAGLAVDQNPEERQSIGAELIAGVPGVSTTSRP
jgi:hypothetical protein